MCSLSSSIDYRRNETEEAQQCKPVLACQTINTIVRHTQMLHYRLCRRCTLASIQCRVKTVWWFMWSKSELHARSLSRRPPDRPITKSPSTPPLAAFSIQSCLMDRVTLGRETPLTKISPIYPPSPFPHGTVLGSKEVYGHQRTIVPSPREKHLHSSGCPHPLT